MKKIRPVFDDSLIIAMRQKIIDSFSRAELTLNKEYKLSKTLTDKGFFRIEIVEAFEGSKPKLLRVMKSTLPKKFLFAPKGGFAEISYSGTYQELQ